MALLLFQLGLVGQDDSYRVLVASQLAAIQFFIFHTTPRARSVVQGEIYDLCFRLRTHSRFALLIIVLLETAWPCMMMMCTRGVCMWLFCSSMERVL